MLALALPRLGTIAQPAGFARGTEARAGFLITLLAMKDVDVPASDLGVDPMLLADLRMGHAYGHITLFNHMHWLGSICSTWQTRHTWSFYPNETHHGTGVDNSSRVFSELLSVTRP